MIQVKCYPNEYNAIQLALYAQMDRKREEIREAEERAKQYNDGSEYKEHEQMIASMRRDELIALQMADSALYHARHIDKKTAHANA